MSKESRRPAGLLLIILQPNGFIYLAYVGAVVLAIGLALLGIGLVRKPK